MSTRADRLCHEPDAVLAEPESAADWIDQQTRRFSARRTAHLIGGGVGATHDEHQREDDYEKNLAVLNRGDSVYLNSHHASDRRMHLWVEAIHETDREVHNE